MIRKYYIICMLLVLFFSSYANEATNFNRQPVFVDRDLKESQIPTRDTTDRISIHKKKIPGEESAELTEGKHNNSLFEDNIKQRVHKLDSRSLTVENQANIDLKPAQEIKKKEYAQEYNQSQATLSLPPDEGSWSLQEHNSPPDEGSYKGK